MTESEMEKTIKEFWKFGDVQIKKIEFYCSKKQSMKIMEMLEKYWYPMNLLIVKTKK